MAQHGQAGAAAAAATWGTHTPHKAFYIISEPNIILGRYDQTYCRGEDTRAKRAYDVPQVVQMTGGANKQDFNSGLSHFRVQLLPMLLTPVIKKRVT